ncbi:hypothetical protein B0T25DRAFT_612020 [Lasiosphaeria hispida]|uniref:Uncharacterized protein n=1 Tax=Lasiosphaeria hispida TaxID=260671 RepID=A0AAJ0HAC7_9PEZI|nr:hypothetical protein B0T25DRAFT_612020 [Lasiosphaeria hispida]
MHFITVTKAIATLMLASSAMAAPAPIATTPEDITSILSSGETATIEARAQQLIDVWETKNFLDRKFTGSGTVGECYDFPKDFQKILSSGKAKSGFRCTVWPKVKCGGAESLSFDINGRKTFTDAVENKAKSWKCQKA